MSSKFTDSQPTIELKVNSPTANVGITDAEYNIRLNPDVEADIFATKTELSAVENKIPAEYVKSAAVADNKLTLTKQDNTVVEFEGGGSYTLPVASTTTLGGVKPDGTTTTVDEDGTIHAHDTTSIATTTTVGSVKPDGTTITIDSNGVISSQTAGAIYKTLPQGSLGDYLKNPVNKAWVIDWANNPDKYIVDVDGCKVIITNKYGSTFYYYYYKSGGASSYYYIYFTDNNFTEISSNQPGWSIADTQYLNESNWQNYITGISPWQNTTNTLDSNLYNAKEVVIFWKDSQDNYHQTYLNVECDRWGNHGSTWGSSDWLNTQIYLDKWDEYNGASITYDGSNVNASNCYIYSICYKT